jgi:DNA-binding winged helix-turn-helix (wHTH) protein
MAGNVSDSLRTIQFGTFELDPRTGELWRNGFRVGLPDQPFQVLMALLEQPGEIVTREELRRRLWNDDTFVDFEHGLNAAVKKLRHVLGDSVTDPKFIETMPRRGYRFIGHVNRGSDGERSAETDRLSEGGLESGRLPLWTRLRVVRVGAMVIAAACLRQPILANAYRALGRLLGMD